MQKSTARNNGIKEVIVCQGLGCQSRGAAQVQEALDSELNRAGLGETSKVKLAGCPGLCEEGPIVMIEPDDIFYTRVKPEDAPEIIQQLQAGQWVERLLYHDETTGEAIPYRLEVPLYK